MFAQFSLYYGRDLVDMQHLKAMQKRQQGNNEDQVLYCMIVDSLPLTPVRPLLHANIQCCEKFVLHITLLVS